MRLGNIFTYFFALLAILHACKSKHSEALKVAKLTCEYLENPIGIDGSNPALSWQLQAPGKGKMQSAYHILVASDLSILEQDKGDLWDSGKIFSTEQLNRKYGGLPLQSFKKYYWKIKVWDENGIPSDWSAVNSWQVGPLDDEDWDAQWISHKYAEVSKKREPFSRYDKSRTFDAQDSMAVYLRKKVEINKSLKRATVFILGLGYYELYINGHQVDDRVMDPVFTDYQKRIKYAGYNVTTEIMAGQNSIGVILGNGFYNLVEPDLFQMEKANWKTPKKLLFKLQLEFEDGSTQFVNSDNSWLWSTGPIVYNSIRGGETFDSRISMEGWNTNDYDVSSWQNVVEVPPPLGKMSFQYIPAMRETRSLKAIAQWSPKENTHVFDFGENLTGYVDLTLHGKPGQVITLDFNEALNADSTLNTQHSSGHTWGRFQQGKLILSGKDSDLFAPRFTYHGFRYLQVSGINTPPLQEAVTARSVHIALPSTGDFECSNPRLNQLQAAVKRTLLNAVHSMPGEEPTREKMGWTFDAGMITMASYFYNFDAITTYKKYLQDLIDAQEPNGHIPPIVPTNGWGFMEKTKDQKDTTIQYDDPWWGGTVLYVAEKLFEFTGDTSIIEMAYTPAKAYADFVASTAQDHLVYWSLGDWLDLQQWANGWGPGLTPIVQTSTAASFYLHEGVARFAEVLGYHQVRNQYRQKAGEIKSKFNRTFLKEDGWYAENSQTAQALPLYLGLTPQKDQSKVLEKLLEAVENNNDHTSVGFVGVTPLLTYLSDFGYRKLVYKMVTQEKSPGWLHFVKNEKSTLGENLNAEGYGTGHHPFAAVIGFWLYEYLGGIRIDRTRDHEITLDPGFDTPLEWVRCTTETLKGRVVSNWRKEGDLIYYQVEIPANATARLILPTESKSITINKKEVPAGKKQVILRPGKHKIEME